MGNIKINDNKIDAQTLVTNTENMAVNAAQSGVNFTPTTSKLDEMNFSTSAVLDTDRIDIIDADRAIVVKDESQTTENSNLYYLNNGTAVNIISASPVNFFDEKKGKWEKIDNTLIDVGNEYVTRNGKVKSSIAKTEINRSVSLRKGDFSVRLIYNGRYTNTGNFANVSKDNIPDFTDPLTATYNPNVNMPLTATDNTASVSTSGTNNQAQTAAVNNSTIKTSAATSAIDSKVSTAAVGGSGSIASAAIASALTGRAAVASVNSVDSPTLASNANAFNAAAVSGLNSRTLATSVSGLNSKATAATVNGLNSRTLATSVSGLNSKTTAAAVSGNSSLLTKAAASDLSGLPLTASTNNFGTTNAKTSAFDAQMLTTTGNNFGTQIPKTSGSSFDDLVALAGNNAGTQIPTSYVDQELMNKLGSGANIGEMKPVVFDDNTGA